MAKSIYAGIGKHYESINAAMLGWTHAYCKGLKAGELAHKAARRGIIVGIENPYKLETHKAEFMRGFNKNFYGKAV